MIRYLAHRVLMMVPTLLVISVLVFAVIQMPPGDYLETYIAELQAQGESADSEKIAFLREQYGLDLPFHQQYANWMFGLLQGDLGFSFEHELPVSEVVGDRIWLSIVLALTTTLFVYIVSFPIGVYSAVKQYSIGDYSFTLLGYLGLSVPNFLFGLVLMYSANVYFGTSIGGLMDSEYVDAPLSWGKFLSVLEHIWIPVVIIGTSGTAGMIRRLRANVLDELQRQYVLTARAKGVPPFKLLAKYPLRLSLNPFIADIGMILPEMISGAVLVSVVLDLPTTGPMLVKALQSQDMFLAGSFLMVEATLVVIGVFLSDLALAALDPRIRLGAGATK